ncbi:MAG: dipeptidase [Verrucomicrobia bacterium]|nr:dipeptidase [Verrucomicrobiota bacterium]MCF7708402.1 dipeptidase [Verrucomicrobiota bacterium]
MKQVLDYIEDNSTKFVEELREYIGFKSISAQPEYKDDTVECAHWLADKCKSLGLDTYIFETSGNPIVVATTRKKTAEDKPHVMIYGHYDVQPPDPLELWESPPFEPRINNGAIYGRGASDNKGQNWVYVKMCEAFMATGSLPCDITFLFEGEEEVGSEHLPEFLRTHRDMFDCDVAIVSDTAMPERNVPALTYGLRGIAALEVEVIGPSRDLHSGIYGGSIENPGMALCKMLSELRDSDGRVSVPGFYDDVLPLTPFEREQFSRLPFDEAAYKELLGVSSLFGEKGFSPWEQRTARPTIEINGITCGYQGEGSKTIIPSRASAKLSCRLVPNQQPELILSKLEDFLKRIRPPGVQLRILKGHQGNPYMFQPDSAYAKAAVRAIERTFSKEAVFTREGGSIPIVNDFKKVLDVDTLLIPLALPDDNHHSPNEKFDLECFRKGLKMGVLLMDEIRGIDA